MRLEYLICLLLCGVAFGQAAPGTASAPTVEVAGIKVGPDDPVITLNGFCSEPAQQQNSCQTVITRAQFEKLTDALQPGMSLTLRLNVANAYARNLRMSAAAEKRALDKTAAFEEEMRFARMQLLSQDLSRELQADANHISDTDLEDYYKKNESFYVQATVARIFVPRDRKEAVTARERADSSAAGMKKVADGLRGRAVNGEDPDKLQMEAYAAAGFERTVPDTKVENVRRTTLPPQHETVLDLNPGEVSEVFPDPAGARFIYKMISKKTLTLEYVKSEIRTAISKDRYRDSMKGFEGDVVFSDAYFSPPETAATPPQQVRRGKRKIPISPQTGDRD